MALTSGDVARVGLNAQRPMERAKASPGPHLRRMITFAISRRGDRSTTWS